MEVGEPRTVRDLQLPFHDRRDAGRVLAAALHAYRERPATDAGGTRATDGCWLDQDADRCQHGHRSWAIVLDLAPDRRGE